MVQRYVVHKSEMHRVDEDDSGTAEWDLVVIHEDYASLKKERDALMKLHELAYNEPNNDEGMHWVNQAVNNLDAWLDK